MWMNVISAIDCDVDIIFVVDESGSVNATNFEIMKSFLSQLVGGLDIDGGNTRVGLVTYSLSVDTAEAFNLNAYSSVADVQSAIAALTFTGRTTYTHLALEYVRTTMLTSATGDRPDVSNAVVVLTDGKSTNASETQVCTIWKLTKTTSLFQKLS